MSMVHSTLDSRLDGQPFSPVMMSLRSQNEPHRSLPGTPLGTDPRALSTWDMGPMLREAHTMMPEDYFSPTSRYTPALRPRSPYPAVGDYEHDGRYLSGGMHSTPEMSQERKAETVRWRVPFTRIDLIQNANIETP